MTTYLIAHIGHTLKQHEHVTWWKPNSVGYTICIDKAGHYHQTEAVRICQTGLCIAVQLHTAELLAKTTPFYRTNDGELVAMYDGQPHRPIENSAKVWRHLLGARLQCSDATAKPTPIPMSRARAIYLPKALQAAP